MKVINIAILSGSIYILGYILLTKKFLPKWTFKPLTRFYFPVMMIPGYLFKINFNSSKRKYWCRVDQTVMLGSVPIVSAGHVRELYEKYKVRRVINLMDEYVGPIAEYEKLNISQAYFPTVDHFEPTLETLEAATRVLSECKKKGWVAYVHCKGGHGRSAAVAAAWLLSKDGGRLNPTQAQNHLNSVGHVRKNLLKQPNLREFFRLHRDTNESLDESLDDESTPLVR